MFGIKNIYRIFIKPTGNRNTIIVIIIYTRQNDNKLRLNGQNENFDWCQLTGYDVAVEKGIQVRANFVTESQNNKNHNSVLETNRGEGGGGGGVNGAFFFFN